MSAEAMAIDDGPGPGTLVGGRYRLLRLVGEGGMGRVFLADDERDGGRVAVKLLADDRPIPKAAQRFEREARAIARIDHANVVRVTEVGQSPRGGLYYVMEYLEGEELATTLEREGPMRWPRAQHIALQICGALQAAHEAGIVHRDLKLENCFLVVEGDDRDFVKILDFGVVKLLSPDLEDGSGRLTNTGATLGTPAYMAPELCRGKQVDHRVDVYALGVMLYELLTGSVPFEGESFLDVALQHMNDPPPRLSDHVAPADLPAGLEAVVMRALAKAREDRFPTMAAFGRALLRVGEDVALAPSPAMLEPLERPNASFSGTAPAVSAVSLAGGTEPALVGVVDAKADGATPIRGARWPWLLAGGIAVAAVGLVAWWLAAAEPTEPREVAEPSLVVDVEPEDRTSGKAATSEPPVDASVDPETATATTEPASVAERSTSGGSTSATPTGLDERQIDGTLRRIQPRVKGCAGSLTGGHPGDRVRVVLRIDRATGRVRSVEASDAHRRSSVESCVREALRKAEFPRAGGRGTQTIKRTLVL
jgi:hypothetical protein